MSAEKHIDSWLSAVFRYIEKVVLIGVGVLTLIGIGQVIWSIYLQAEVRLEDLLLMFIFVEILAMTNVYFVKREVPFTFPMFIAVTALSRLVVLQGKSIAPENLLYESGAILLVSIAILVVRASERFSGEDPVEVTKPPEED